MTDFDFSDLTRLTADLGKVGPGVVPNVEKALERTARNVKDAWNDKLYTEGHAKLTGRSISYDVGVARSFHLFALDEGGYDAAALVAEVGAKTGSGRQAGIVRLLENGSVHNAPHGYGSGALAENESDFERGIDAALRDAERAAGL